MDFVEIWFDLPRAVIRPSGAITNLLLEYQQYYLDLDIEINRDRLTTQPKAENKLTENHLDKCSCILNICYLYNGTQKNCDFDKQIIASLKVAKTQISCVDSIES